MKVLVIGNGAREHTIAWKYSQSKRLTGLYLLPGNGGTSQLGKSVTDIDPWDGPAIADFCKSKSIDMVFVGPEAPLAAGVVDSLLRAGVKAIGPHQEAAQLESSKAFSKSFMVRNKIPTAGSETFHDRDSLEKYLSAHKGRKLVIKKSGLAAGKGVLESEDHGELLDFALAHIDDGPVLVEDFLVGYEISIFALLDGNGYTLLPATADYKKAGENETGPNTGGMGAICPVPWLDNGVLDAIEKEIVLPTITGLKKDGLMYKGVLYFGLMITENGPMALEYNVRFGDPEAQVLIPLIQRDFCDLSEALFDGELHNFSIPFPDQAALGVVLAAPGYPGQYPKGIPVTITDHLAPDCHLIFQASTMMSNDQLVTGGGRCFTAVGIGNTHDDARDRAYRTAQTIEFKGCWYRPDIGAHIYDQ